MQELTHVPENNFESFQVLRYAVGQYYRTHHDMSEEDNKVRKLMKCLFAQIMNPQQTQLRCCAHGWYDA
jgi:hypothetical protein